MTRSMSTFKDGIKAGLEWKWGGTKGNEVPRCHGIIIFKVFFTVKKTRDYLMYEMLAFKA